MKIGDYVVVGNRMREAFKNKPLGKRWLGVGIVMNVQVEQIEDPVIRTFTSVEVNFGSAVKEFIGNFDSENLIVLTEEEALVHEVLNA